MCFHSFFDHWMLRIGGCCWSGLRGPAILVVYYLLLGQVKMRLMPDFKRLTMMQSELEGDYRTAHSRLIANSEVCLKNNAFAWFIQRVNSFLEDVLSSIS